jgi:ABC-type multidrug transport system fused ATPase/permease subunit
MDNSVGRSLRSSQFNLSFEGISEGLATEIGERGVNLSGGQRQRINLARAHHNPRDIILMDDCLSAVDVDTERALIEDLFLHQWKGATRILVTHRLSILPHVDKVIFMEGGEIADHGTFQELLKRSRKFASFVSTLEKEANAKSTPQTSGGGEPSDEGTGDKYVQI